MAQLQHDAEQLEFRSSEGTRLSKLSEWKPTFDCAACE